MVYQNKINAIKNLRHAVGFGLRESKDLIEAAQETGMLDIAARDIGYDEAEKLAMMRLCYLIGRAVEQGHAADDVRDMLRAVYGGEKRQDLRVLVEAVLT